MSNKNIIKNDSLNISLDVKNTGNYDGDEVVQLYVKNLTTRDPQPNKDLRAFKRVFLNKGETKTVQFVLKAEQLRYFDEEKNTYVIWPGKYEIQVGASSEDIRLKDNLTIE
jgi:beta-glucosidase